MTTSAIAAETATAVATDNENEIGNANENTQPIASNNGSAIRAPMPGNGFSIAVERNENVKMLTASPPPKTTTVSIVKAGLRASRRHASRKSCRQNNWARPLS